MKRTDHRRRLWAAVVALTAALIQILMPAGALNAAASTDETLGTGRMRTAVSVDLARLLDLPGRGKEHAGRILIPGGSAVGVAIATRGLLVVGLSEGAGMQAGLRAGDLLLSVNGAPLDSATMLTDAVSAAGGQPISLEVE